MSDFGIGLPGAIVDSLRYGRGIVECFEDRVNAYGHNRRIYVKFSDCRVAFAYPDFPDTQLAFMQASARKRLKKDRRRLMIEKYNERHKTSVFAGKRVIFAKVAWMNWYRGDRFDKPVNGGSYVHDHGTGFEIYNMRRENGYVYGFFEMGGRNVNLENIDRTAAGPNSLDGVTVVWCATPEVGETRVVAIWENATVYSSPQHIVRSNGVDSYYQVSAKAGDAHLFRADTRLKEPLLTLPLTEGGRCIMGRTFVYYPLSANRSEEVRQYTLDLLSGWRAVKEKELTDREAVKRKKITDRNAAVKKQIKKIS